ncbi:MAG TPA: hypothetical protein VNT60_10340, partial [Deinococcales bacterium]|nr:hypothetical protein [Deinococcales bacterium]
MGQEEAREAVRAMFAGAYRDVDRLVTVFENGLIATRYWSAPLDYFLTERSWPERNDLYSRVAVDLGEAAARQALARARLEPRDVDAIIFVSTTGVATPSLDAQLIKRLDLDRHTLRLPRRRLPEVDRHPRVKIVPLRPGALREEVIERG